jgi:hypothetical protein
VDVGECAATRPLLLDTGGTGRLAEHPALSNENDMAVGKLLLQLPCEPMNLPQSVLHPTVTNTKLKRIEAYLCWTFRNAFS